MLSVSCAKHTSMLVAATAALIVMSSPTSSQSSSKSITNPDFSCGEPYGPNGEPPTRRVARQIVLPSDANYTQYLDQRRKQSEQNPADSASCGASPISEHFLITAAHCVTKPNKIISHVILGDLDWARNNENNSRRAQYDLDAIIVHPDYRDGTYVRYNDVALLRTAKPIQFNEVVFPYCVSDVPPAHGTIVTVSGFGYYNATTRPTHLLEADFMVVDTGMCEDAYLKEGLEHSLRLKYPNLLRGSDIICAVDDVSDSCQGDSGGPLFRVKDGKRFLEGIVSGGGSCRGSFKPELPGQYLSVAKHVQFINKYMFINPIKLVAS